jgi:hypothetical protein
MESNTNRCPPDPRNGPIFICVTDISRMPGMEIPQFADESCVHFKTKASVNETNEEIYMSDREVSLCKWKIKMCAEKSTAAVFAKGEMRRLPGSRPRNREEETPSTALAEYLGMLQMSCFWTLSIVMFLSKTPSCLQETESCLRNIVFRNINRTMF